MGAWPPGPGHWAVFRHADVKHVLRGPAEFSSHLGAHPARTRVRAVIGRAVRRPNGIERAAEPVRMTSNLQNGLEGLTVRRRSVSRA
ncbi:hypothetical protein [Wenjunlia tyrosinilytica]|uniref:Uncharacterized protein n=1 Tax=Wenjunlia tyrosinilytica TaxID=1544741 RepID=A0A917ZTB3_9ACTN|nr:hypothetical protein GCM10012280_37690 [Wenjunlia tyrosinilytica]